MRFEPQSAPTGTVRDWLDHHAETIGDKVSHLFPDGSPSLTWRDLRDQARGVAQFFTNEGIAKGESIAMCMPNSRSAIITLFGIMYGGFRATTLNLAAGPMALAHAVTHSDAGHIVIEKDCLTIYETVLSETDARPIQLIITGDDISNICSAKARALHGLNSNDHVLLMYTSGTTGLPKGVVHSHSSLLAGGWTTAIAHQLCQSDRALCVLPFFHINGLCVTLIAPLISGGSVVVCPKFSNNSFWANCDAFEVTWFSVVPTIISHILHNENNPSKAAMARIRFGRSASAPLAVETQRSFEQRFDIPIIETMGLTETAAQILSNPLPPGVRKIGSPGVPYGNRLRIADENNNELPKGQIGELVVKGPNTLLEYLKNPTATQEAFTHDGWLRTGDLGLQDSDGYVYVTGRLKELIIKGGENIAPREIDEVLYTHEDIIEAAAFARDCKTYGQRVDAAVVARPGSLVTGKELVTLCHRKLGNFKSPDTVYILSNLPKGPSGKIQRLKLAELIETTES